MIASGESLRRGESSRLPSSDDHCAKSERPKDTGQDSARTPAGLGQYEGQDALPDWWLSVGREDIPKLIVVDKYHQKHDADKVQALMATDAYKATRQAAVDQLEASKKPKQTG